MHGARGGRPIIHGRYSRVMTRLRGIYESSLQDKRLLDLREPIAVIDALVQSCIERAEAGDTPDWRARILALASRTQQAHANGNAVEVGNVLGELAALVEHGVEDDRRIAAIGDNVERFARRIEGAWKVKLARGHAMDAKDVGATLAQFFSIVLEEGGVDVRNRVVKRVEEEILRAKKMVD